MSEEFRRKNIEETKIYFIKEIDQNQLMSNKHKSLGTILNYIEHFFFSFCSYWMYLNFCFCFFAWYFYRNYKFYNRIKNLY